MVFTIECSDECEEHVELRSDGSIRLFGRYCYDQENGAFTVTPRQFAILVAMMEAKAKLEATQL